MRELLRVPCTGFARASLLRRFPEDVGVDGLELDGIGVLIVPLVSGWAWLSEMPAWPSTEICAWVRLRGFGTRLCLE